MIISVLITVSVTASPLIKAMHMLTPYSIYIYVCTLLQVQLEQSVNDQRSSEDASKMNESYGSNLAQAITTGSRSLYTLRDKDNFM